MGLPTSIEAENPESTQSKHLLLGTVSFTVCFAAWGLISAFAPHFRQQFRLSATQAALLVATGEPLVMGELEIPDGSPRLLAEGHFLAFIVDPKHSGQIRSPAQFQFEFGGDSLLIFSLFGMAEIDYPADQSFYFNQADLQPKWEAWALRTHVLPKPR